MQFAYSKVSHNTTTLTTHSTSVRLDLVKMLIVQIAALARKCDINKSRQSLAVPELCKPKDREEQWRPENIRKLSAGSVLNYVPAKRQKKKQSEDVTGKLKGDDSKNQRLRRFCDLKIEGNWPVKILEHILHEDDYLVDFRVKLRDGTIIFALASSLLIPYYRQI